MKELQFANKFSLLDFFANAFMADGDSELKNICDEIKAELDKLKYLLTLK